MSAERKDEDELEQVSVTFNPELPMDKLEIADENVRKHERTAGLEDLKNSIKHVGLIQPIIVTAKGEKFRVVVGQRRFLAVQELGEPTIKALIIGKATSRTLMMLSFGENIHRRKLPYDDTIQVCDVLFKDYKGSKTERIRQIAADLGISYGTVKKYLAHQLVPKEVRKMVSDGVMSATMAGKITNAFWPNDQRIISVARMMKDMTESEFDRLLDLGPANPEKPLEDLTEEAKQPPKDVEVKITISFAAKNWLEAEAYRREMTFNELVREAIDEYMEVEA